MAIRLIFKWQNNTFSMLKTKTSLRKSNTKTAYNFYHLTKCRRNPKIIPLTGGGAGVLIHNFWDWWLVPRFKSQHFCHAPGSRKVILWFWTKASRTQKFLINRWKHVQGHWKVPREWWQQWQHLLICLCFCLRLHSGWPLPQHQFPLHLATVPYFDLGIPVPPHPTPSQLSKPSTMLCWPASTRIALWMGKSLMSLDGSWVGFYCLQLKILDGVSSLTLGMKLRIKA